MKYSIFTVSLPECTPEEAAEKLAACGYDGVEWRITKPVDPSKIPAGVPAFWSNNLCTIDQEKILDEVDRLQAITEKYNIETCAFGTYFGCNDDLELIEKAMKAASMMKVPIMRIGAGGYNGTQNYNEIFKNAVEKFGPIQELAKKYGVKVVVEMHMGTITPSASAAYRFVSNFDPKYVGVLYDTGNIVNEGYEDYKMALEILGEYLAHVHIKNTVWKKVGEEDGVEKYSPVAAPLKKGCADYKKFFTALKSVGYDGWISFEDFSTEESNIDKLKTNIDFIKPIVDEIYNG